MITKKDFEKYIDELDIISYNNSSVSEVAKKCFKLAQLYHAEQLNKSESSKLNELMEWIDKWQVVFGEHTNKKEEMLQIVRDKILSLQSKIPNTQTINNDRT